MGMGDEPNQLNRQIQAHGCATWLTFVWCSVVMVRLRGWLRPRGWVSYLDLCLVSPPGCLPGTDLSVLLQPPSPTFSPPARSSRGCRAPDWLMKWAALVLEYVELERRELPEVLLQLPPQLGKYTKESAEIEAEVRWRGAGMGGRVHDEDTRHRRRRSGRGDIVTE